MAEIGSGSGSGYSAVIDTDNAKEINSPNSGKTLARAALFNDQAAALVNIETKLGAGLIGSATNFKTRIQAEHNLDGTHNNIWKLQERQEVTSATNTMVISGLDGNTDILYWLFMRVVGGGAVETYAYLRPNNDSTANYGYQFIQGNDTFIGAGRNTASTGLYGGHATPSRVSMFKGLLYAKSGYVRTLNAEITTNTTGTAVGTILKMDSVWANTTDNITSLVVYASVANGLGIGTFVELWRRT